MTKTVRTKNKEVSLDALGLEAGKVPPQALDVEEAVLGAMMIEPGCVPDVLESLTAGCFYKEAHRRIFTAISDLARDHEPVDIYTVAEALKRSGSLDEVGGPYYLSLLSSKVGAAAHVDYHVKILLQKYIQRELITISAEVQRDSFDDSIPVDDLLNNAQQKLFELAERNMKRETLPVQDVLKDAVAEIEANQDRTDGLSGVPSGFTGIDKVTLGWQESDLVIIAARPSMGKTAFVLTVARNMALYHHIPVAFFSLEMSSKQLVKRLLVSETGLSSEKIRGGQRLRDYELVQLHERIKDLAAAPLFIDDTPSISVYELRSKVRRLVRNAGVKLIIVDYLQLMTGPPELRGMREQEVSNISRSLKAIAKEMSIPVIALSQLSRDVEKRGGNKIPQLSDLRESGAIEQDADIVMFIHRPDYYGTEDEKSLPGQAQIIIAKHRNGSTGDVSMIFRKSEARFVDSNDIGFQPPEDDIEGYQGVESSMNNPSDFESAF